MVRGVDIDTTGWPLVIARMNDEQSDAEFQSVLDVYTGFLDRGEPYGLVLVTSPDRPMIKPSQARLQVQWIRDNEARLSRLCLGVAFVLQSPLMRGALRAILAMQSLPSPHRVLPTEADAVAWVRNRLRSVA